MVVYSKRHTQIYYCASRKMNKLISARAERVASAASLYAW